MEQQKDFIKTLSIDKKKTEETKTFHFYIIFVSIAINLRENQI